MSNRNQGGTMRKREKKGRMGKNNKNKENSKKMEEITRGKKKNEE